MEAWAIVLDMVILLAAALVLGIIAEQLKQNAIVGYIAAGMLVGPNVFKVVGSGSEMEMIAEVGASLLLFSIGLEFSIKRLRRLGIKTLLTGVLQIGVTLGVGFAVAKGFGLEVKTAIVIGAIVTLSSTACVVRVLMDRTQLESSYGRSALGVLLLQDVAVVPLMVLVTALTSGGTGKDIAITLGKTMGLGVLMIGVFYLLLNYVIKWLLYLPSISRNRELPIILATVLAVGSAVAAHKVGMSATFGAFLAGLLLAESPFARQIRADIDSLGTLLITLFFASIGMMGEPIWIASHVGDVAAVTGMVIAGKCMVVTLVMLILGYRISHGFATGLTISQVGEFSFMLVGVAYMGGALELDTFRLVIAFTIISLILTPYMAVIAEKVYHRKAGASGQEKKEHEGEKRKIIIVGFGPAGQRVAEVMLEEHKDDIVVVEINPKSSKLAETYGLAFCIGDARHGEVLEEVGLEEAKLVVVTVPDHMAARQVIESCKSKVPDCPVLVRSRHHIFQGFLYLAGADKVIDEEDQIGQALAAEAKERLHPQVCLRDVMDQEFSD